MNVNELESSSRILPLNEKMYVYVLYTEDRYSKSETSSTNSSRTQEKENEQLHRYQEQDESDVTRMKLEKFTNPLLLLSCYPLRYRYLSGFEFVEIAVV